MGLDIKVVQQYNNGYVQLEATDKNKTYGSYYLPAKNVKKFGDDLILNRRNSNINSNIALGGSALIGVLGANIYTKNKSKVIDLTAKFVTAVLLAGITGYFVNDYNSTKYTKLLNKHNAKEIDQTT